MGGGRGAAVTTGDVATDALGEGGPLGPEDAKLLLRYLSILTVLAFYARAMPGPFLPIVLMEEFHQKESMVGLVTAAYPIAALLATPKATRLAGRSKNIFKIHSLALLGLASSNGIFSSIQLFRVLLGPSLAILVVISFRMVQGCAFAFYIAANTTLITRVFPRDVPYILALIEVGVGVGANVGRLLGGVAYDWGGFAFPFYSIAIAQAAWAAIGTRFHATIKPSRSSSLDGSTKHNGQSAEEGENSNGNGGEKTPSTAERLQVSWTSLLMRRVVLGMVAVLLNYFQAGFYDATLAPHLKSFLQLQSTTLLSCFFALRSTMYLCTSYICAEILKRRTVSFEMLICVGALAVSFGFILIPPQAFVLQAWRALLGYDDVTVPIGQLMAFEGLAIIIGSCGPAFLFVPSLPLMQSEVQHLGTTAVEQTTALFMSMMSLGEASGPFLGGWLVETLGFSAASLAAMPLCLGVMVSALSLRDPDVDAERRRLAEGHDAATANSDSEAAQGFEVDRVQRRANFSSENALWWQIVKTKLQEGRNDNEALSVPSSMFRRAYSPLPPRACSKGSATAPSTSWRRAYASPTHSLSGLQVKDRLSASLAAPLLERK